MSGPPPGLEHGLPVPPPPLHPHGGVQVPPLPPVTTTPPVGIAPVNVIPPPLHPNHSVTGTKGQGFEGSPQPGSAISTPHEDSIQQQGPQPQAFDLASYAYNVGFIHTAWADTFLNIAPHPPLRLHALFVSRSPVLYRLLTSSNSPSPPYHLNLNTDDRNITTMSLSMALATLYGHGLDLNNCTLETAKGLLAAGCLLSIDPVAQSGYQVLLSHINPERLQEVFAFAMSNAGDSYDEIDFSFAGPYPPYTKNLVSILVEFVLSNFNASVRPIDELHSSLFATLPFHLIKHICESDKLQVKNQMERHAFAREIIAARSKHRRDSGIIPQYEESGVLAFGGGKGGVEIIRKAVGKKKTLWKAAN